MKNFKISSPTNLLAVTIWAAAIILISIYLLQNLDDNQSNPSTTITRAAIIDQLHDDLPSPYFQNKITEYLLTAGYEVDLYTTKDITVNFYKALPSKEYDLIVVRSHSVAAGTVEKSASIFTGEIYSESKFIQEQLFGQIGKAVPFLSSEVEEIGWTPLVNKTYFVVGSKFVDDLMVDSFSGSVIILGGCDTASGNVLARSLLKRGASEVVGWDGLIGSRDNDAVLIALLEKILLEDIPTSKAVEMVMEDFNPRSKYSPTLKYYS